MEARGSYTKDGKGDPRVKTQVWRERSEAIHPTLSDQGAWAHNGESQIRHWKAWWFASLLPHAPDDRFMFSYVFLLLLSLPLAFVHEYYWVPTYSMVS